MRIVHERPPNWDKIYAELGPFYRTGIIFTYGDTVYMPDGGELAPDLEAHEAIHVLQQADDPEGWWDKYLSDVVFRLGQEVQAHQAEYAYLKNEARLPRPVRRRAARNIAKRLSGPLYGNLINFGAALLLVKGKGSWD